MIRMLLVSALTVLVLSPDMARSQDASVPVSNRPAGASSQSRDEVVRVQVNMSLFMPGPTGEGEDAEKVREDARRSIYVMAGKECEIILGILARECRLETVNVTVNNNRHSGGNQPFGYQVQGALSLRVVLR